MKQSTITYNKDNLTITIEGMDEVEKALEDLKRKTPAAAKVAINATAREARKLMIAQAKARYAVNAKGAQHLKDLKTSGKKGHNATNTNLEAVLFIAKPRADLAYFQHRPTQSFSGRAVLHNAPEYVQARILKSSSMRKLGAEDIEVRGRSIGPGSKGFLVEFSNGHVGMVQRQLGSSSSHRDHGQGTAALDQPQRTGGEADHHGARRRRRACTAPCGPWWRRTWWTTCWSGWKSRSRR